LTLAFPERLPEFLGWDIYCGVETKRGLKGTVEFLPGHWLLSRDQKGLPQYVRLGSSQDQGIDHVINIDSITVTRTTIYKRYKAGFEIVHRRKRPV